MSSAIRVISPRRFYTDNLAAVRANFAEWKNVRIIAGAIPETLDQLTAQQVAFLHIDMN